MPEKKQPNKNPAAVALGKLGGKKGGGWMRRLPEEERRRRMRELILKRWDKRRA